MAAFLLLGHGCADLRQRGKLFVDLIALLFDERLLLLSRIVTLRTPVIELEEDTRANFELYLSPALDGVMPRIDATCLADGERPDSSVNFDRSTVAPVVIHNCEIGLSILRGC